MLELHHQLVSHESWPPARSKCWLSLSNSYGFIPNILQSMSIPFTPLPINHFHFVGQNDIIIDSPSRIFFSEDPQDTLPKTNKIARWTETRAPKRKWSNFQPSIFRLCDSPQGATGDWTCAEGFAGEAPHLNKKRLLDLWLTDFRNERQWSWKSMYQMKLSLIIKFGLSWFDFVCFIFLYVYDAYCIRRNSLWSSWFYSDNFMNLLRRSNL